MPYRSSCCTAVPHLEDAREALEVVAADVVDVDHGRGPSLEAHKGGGGRHCQHGALGDDADRGRGAPRLPGCPHLPEREEVMRAKREWVIKDGRL